MLQVALIYTLEGLRQSRRTLQLLCVMAALLAALFTLALWEAAVSPDPTIPKTAGHAEYAGPGDTLKELQDKASEYSSGQPDLSRTLDIGHSNAERLPAALHQATLQRGWLSSNVRDGILVTLPEHQLQELDNFINGPPAWLKSTQPAPVPGDSGTLANVLIETHTVPDHTLWPMRLISMTQTAVLAVFCVLMLMALHKFVATTDFLRGKRSHPPWMTAFSKGLPKSAEGRERNDGHGKLPCQDCGNPTGQINRTAPDPDPAGLCRWCEVKRDQLQHQ